MVRKHFVTTIILGLTGALSFACSEPDWVGGDLESSSDATKPESDDDDDDSSDGECVEDGEASGAADDGKPGLGIDPSSLKACCEDEGKAHCVDEALVSSSKDKLTACEGGGRCVPDTIIEGKEAKSCTSSVTNSAGKCLSPCIAAVAEKKSLLKADGCSGGELCAPCDLGGTPTGACEIGKSKGGGGGAKKKKVTCPSKDNSSSSSSSGATPPPTTPTPPSGGCCGGKGLCVTKDIVEAKMPGKSDQLEAHECKDGKLCAPTENAAADFKPKKCTGKSLIGLITGPYEGVCLSNCLKFSTTQQFASDQGDCDDDHRCMPCEMLGKPTGAPGCE